MVYFCTLVSNTWGQWFYRASNFLNIQAPWASSFISLLWRPSIEKVMWQASIHYVIYIMHILGSRKCVLFQFDIITNILY